MKIPYLLLKTRTKNKHDPKSLSFFLKKLLRHSKSTPKACLAFLLRTKGTHANMAELCVELHDIQQPPHVPVCLLYCPPYPPINGSMDHITWKRSCPDMHFKTTFKSTRVCISLPEYYTYIRVLHTFFSLFPVSPYIFFFSLHL